MQNFIKASNNQIQLPIDQKETAIKQSLRDNQLTIIETPTGSGKTMKVPYWANQISNKPVYCLVPRVVMAKGAQEGAQKLIWNEVWHKGNECAFATGRGDFGQKAACVTYITEGSFIQRNIADKLPVGSYVLIDEVHEQGAMTEALLVLAKSMLKKGLKVVLMSATLDVAKYQEFYLCDKFSVGVVSLPPVDRPFPLTFEVVENPLHSICDAAADGGRCLMFVEGKMELDNTIELLKSRLRNLSNDNVKVFGFHGEMEDEEQELPLKHKGAMVIVATNVLQSGVTINGLTHLYTNGVGKRIESVGGRRTLKAYELSKAEMQQQFGRVGRTCNGTIFWSAKESEEFNNRAFMPIAEIKRVPLEDTVLTFQSIGLNLRHDKCLNQPTITNIEIAENLLTKLSCLNNEGFITVIGHSVVRQGVGLRGGIIQILGDQFGLSNTVRKVALMFGSNHPFRKANYGYFRKECKGLDYCDYIMWVAIIDSIIEKYGYNVKTFEFELFRHEMENNGLFRKTLVSLMRKFKYIDAEHNDSLTDAKDVKESIQRIFKTAFADCIIEVDYGSMETPEGQYLQPSQSSNVDLSTAKLAVGEINQFEVRGFVRRNLEGVTVIDERKS